ncbi:unnamed protein product [Periconia digitata]|uniref:Uncharacterized protein n=1 Tax=Periconia digitata TaxID=1303443 RepID=A0A9W4XJP9_9PLEO|nr:unnamed protein product [Periconia digitata]
MDCTQLLFQHASSVALVSAQDPQLLFTIHWQRKIHAHFPSAVSWTFFRENDNRRHVAQSVAPSAD